MKSSKSFERYEPEYNEKILIPYLVQPIGMKKEKQSSAFGGAGYYAKFNKNFYDKFVKTFNVKGMGFSEFEGENFPETLEFLSECIKRDLIFLGNFNLKNGQTIFFMCHEHIRNQIPKTLLNWEKSLKSKKRHRTKGHDMFDYVALQKQKADICGWFSVGNDKYFFSTSKETTKKLYLMLKRNKMNIGDY